MNKQQKWKLSINKFQIFWFIISFFYFFNFVEPSEMFDLNIDKINYVYHRAAIMALLKSRASTLIKSGSIPYSDQIIYKQCSTTASSPIMLAKCVAKLLEIKDNVSFYHQEDPPSAIEKLGEIFFGKKIYPSISPEPPKAAAAQSMDFDDEESPPLRRVIPSKYNTFQFRNKFSPNENYGKPVAAKEFYFTQNNRLGSNSQIRAEAAEMPALFSNPRLPLKSRNNYFYHQNFERRRRVKREMFQSQKQLKNSKNKKSADFENLSNLEKITKYYKMLSYCEAFFKRLNGDNSQFINSASKIPYRFELRKDKKMTIIENVFNALEGMLGSTAAKSKFSFLSPQLFSILPSENKKRKHLLSPSLFSFQENDGLFSLPNFFKNFNMNEKIEKDLIETLLEISGASKTLENLVKEMEPQIKEMNEKIFPSILELEKIEKDWKMVANSYTPEQQADIREIGYAFLEPEQLELLYSKKGFPKLKLNLTDYAGLSKNERQNRIDDDIKKLAKLSDDDVEFIQDFSRSSRFRRQAAPPPVEVHPDNGEITTGNAGDHHDYSQEAPGTHGALPHFITLEPWAFGSRIGQGIALEVVTLSPYAFFTEIMMPEALVVQTLGPRAFIPAILSPQALIARILSPAAFIAEILSPRALTAYVMTPEALIAEILTPKFLETRILSPEALIIQILSPSILAPRIASPEAGALVILSPSILSPRISSGHTMVVEVLSPHLLGGGHSSHEDAEQGMHHNHQHDEHVDTHDIVNSGNAHGQDHGQDHGHGNEHIANVVDSHANQHNPNFPNQHQPPPHIRF